MVFSPSALAQINPSSPATNWTVITYGWTGGPVADPTADSRTGIVEAEIVGTTNRASLYKLFYDGGTPSLTDGQLAFRMRLAADSGSAGFGKSAFVGLDGNGDGKLDIFVAVNNSAANNMTIWPAGNGANNSPSTTTVGGPPLFTYTENASNYNWIVVDATSDPGQTQFDLDGGGQPDQFLSFVIPFADVVSAMNSVGVTNFNQNSVVNFVGLTGNQDGKLNQDINGVNGGTSSTNSWFNLGALSDPYTVIGVNAVPEPATVSLFALSIGAVGFVGLRRRSE